MLDDLAHVRLALLFAGGCADRVERVGRLDEDGVVDDDLGVGPAGGEAGVGGSAVWGVGRGMWGWCRERGEKDDGEKGDVRPRDEIKQLLCLAADALALLRILLLHLADRLLLAGLQRREIDLCDAGQRGIEAGSCLGGMLACADYLKRQDVCEWDDVVVAGLAGQRRGWVRGRGGRVDGDGIGRVAGGEEGAFEDGVGGRAGDLDAEGELEADPLCWRHCVVTYREPTAL